MVNFEREITLISELESQSDRGAAIIATAWLEEGLTAAIKSKLNTDSAAWQKLFEGSGPMATFSAKIEIAKLLGILSSENHSDLNTIRKIRNDFAHEIMSKNFGALAFDTPNIKDRCFSLKRTADEAHTNPRIAFIRSCVALYADFNLLVWSSKNVPQNDG